MPPETDPVALEVYIDAEPAVVYEFFVDAEKLCRWLAVEAELDPRPGGRCSQIHEGAARGGGRCEMRGEYVVVDPPCRVSFTWGFVDSAVAVPVGSSIVDVQLTPTGSGTTVRLEHRHLHGPEIDEHRQGWNVMLSRLARALVHQSTAHERSQP